MRVAIYGLGEEGLIAEKSLRSAHTLIGFTDSFAHIKKYAGYDYYTVEELKEKKIDFIIIALNNRLSSEDVRQSLTEKGFKEPQILDFYQLFTLQKIDKVLRVKEKKCTGLILGISHAASGIFPKYLEGEWYNLANGSEDLFYHYKVLEKCEKEYAEKIENLQQVIIDLYDYTIFDYDVSLSNVAVNYWSHGGFYEDEHHFSENINYKDSSEEELRKAGWYSSRHTKEEIMMRDVLFDEKKVAVFLETIYECKGHQFLGYNDYPLRNQLLGSIAERPALPANLWMRGQKRYKSTIDENKEILGDIVHLLKKINPNMKIVFLLMPRYKYLETYHEELLRAYQEPFFDYLSPFLKDRNTFFWNYKGINMFSENPHFYQDTAHFNYIGAIAFSSELNERLSELRT